MTNQRPKSAILLVLIVFFAHISCKAIGSHFIENFTDSPVNLGGQTWAVSPYNADWIFFGNKNGLYQFNGNNWSTVNMHNGADVRSVFVGKSTKRIYMGGINEFGYATPDDRGFLRYTCLSDSVGKNKFIGNIWGIFEHEGHIYAQGDHDILVSKGSKSNIIRSYDKLNCSNLLHGVLYVGTDHGLKVLVGQKISPAYGAEALANMRVRSILPYRDGALVVTANNGIYFYNGNSTEKLQVDSAWQARLTDLFCGAIQGNNLAIGTVANGLFVIDLASGAVEHYSQDNGMQNNTVLSLAFDCEGNLWAGMDSGIDRLRFSLPVTELFNGRSAIGAGYVAQILDGQIYLGTNRGLYVAPFSTTTTMLNASLFGGLTGQVWGLESIGDDQFCLHDHGLLQLRGGSLHPTDVTDGAWHIVPFRSNPNRAYVGTYDGLRVIEKDAAGNWSTIKDIDDCYVSVYSFVTENDHCIWYVNSRTDVVRLTLDAQTFAVKSATHYNRDKGLPVSADMNVYNINGTICFTSAGGIYRYDKASDRIVSYDEMDDRLGNRRNILRLETHGRYTFALTPKEVIRSDGKNIVSLPSMPLRARSFHPAHIFTVVNDSTVIVPNHKGYSAFNFGQARRTMQLPEKFCRISRVSLTERGDSAIYISNYLQHKPKLEISYRDNSFKIEFGVPAQDMPFVDGYRYRLNDGQWSELTHSNFKEYTNLSEGEYTFVVEVVTPTGQKLSDTISFEIMPPWYRSVIAKIIYGLLLLLAIWWVYRLSNKRVARAERLAEERKNEELKLKDKEIHALEKQQLQVQIEHKSQEIVNLLLSQSSKNEALINIREELMKIRANLKGDPANRKALIALQEQIDTALQSEKILDRVEKEFDLVHNDFTKKLRADYPDLSSNEIKICSYIKMNLSTKEIAPLMNMSMRGVETIRYRMRKKFGLDRADSLTEFIRNI